MIIPKNVFMKIKFIYLGMLATVFAASCSNEEVLETNANFNGEPIDFSSSVKSPTRAVITTLNNLGDFNVYAKGIRSDLGTLYKPFMIGDNETKAPAVANRVSVSAENGTWKLSKDVYWPSDINTALFWAFSDRRFGEKPEDIASIYGNTDKCIATGTVGFKETSGPQIENYKPLKADITKDAGENTGWFDGDHQRDLVSAFTQQTKNPHVNLNFHHLLSQIEINAVSKHASTNDESRIVKIKGAWLVNVKSTGTLSANFTYSQDTQTATDNPSWTLANSLEQYGTVYSSNDRTVPIVVNGSPDPLNVLGNNGHGNLMLIPQITAQWDGIEATTQGAYLLLLCRVDMGHKGEVLDGTAVSPVKDGMHYHQQFPVSTYYDEDAYGLTAIPVPVEWEMGKKYTYNLDICGENSGAGKYPPNVPTEETALAEYVKTFIPGTLGREYVLNSPTKPEPTKVNIITTIASGKNVGDYVLDDPIQFSVTVSGWGDGDTWTNGNETGK